MDRIIELVHRGSLLVIHPEKKTTNDFLPNRGIVLQSFIIHYIKQLIGTCFAKFYIPITVISGLEMSSFKL